MDQNWRETIWHQFGAAIDMLENAITHCPDEVWADESKPTDFQDYWYIAYHTLFWLDLYLHGAVEGFTPPPPYTLGELDPAGIFPERVYSREELKNYLACTREKCRVTIAGLTDDAAQRHCAFPWGETSYAELLLYSMRHVQHHAAQLNLILRQSIDSAPRWVAIARQTLAN